MPALGASFRGSCRWTGSSLGFGDAALDELHDLLLDERLDFGVGLENGNGVLFDDGLPFAAVGVELPTAGLGGREHLVQSGFHLGLDQLPDPFLNEALDQSCTAHGVLSGMGDGFGQPQRLCLGSGIMPD